MYVIDGFHRLHHTNWRTMTSGEGFWSGDADEENRSSIRSVVDFDEEIVGRRRISGGRRIVQRL